MPMHLLAIALALVPPALIALCWIRSKSDGEETGKRLDTAAWLAAIAVGAGLALGFLPANIHIWVYFPGAELNGWLKQVRVGAIIGLSLFVFMRLLVLLLPIALHRWACRLPPEHADTVGHRLVVELSILAGFMVVFAVMMSLALLVGSLGLPTWPFLPLLIGLLPLYQTFGIPWLQFIRAPRLTSRNIVDLEAWLDQLCRERRLPRFSVRIQEGRLANAFAGGGFGAHLIVIGGGLLDGMSVSQLRAVLAHEIGHVEQGHVPRFILPLLVTGLTLYVLCVTTFSNPLFAQDTLLSVAAGAGLAGVSGALFFLALPGFFMRKMEFQADRLAVDMIGDGEELVDALTKLAELNRESLGSRSWSHPTIQARIDAIRSLPGSAPRAS